MAPSDWMALVAGIYASIVATIALVWNIVRERRNVTVRVNYAFGVGFYSGSESVAIEIINNGRHPINIEEIGFLLSNGIKLINPSAQHNLGWLRDGDGTSYYIPRQDIEEMVKEARKRGERITHAYVRDSTSRYHEGKISKSAAWFH